jgi:tRNA1Val (adenine37-N6)-methyltransferase
VTSEASRDVSVDEVCRGEVIVVQPRRGYRFSIDALLLADFARRLNERAPVEQIVDLGAGCGVVGLLLARRFPSSRVELVELQPELAELACDGARRSGLADRVTVRNADLRRLQPLLPGASVDMVACNPPYELAGEGTPNPDLQRATDRHQQHGSLDDIARAARRLLRPRGRLLLVYPAEGLFLVGAALMSAGFSVERVCPVAPRQGADPNRVLVMGRKGGRALVRLEPTLHIYESSGAYSDDARRVLNEP